MGERTKGIFSNEQTCAKTPIEKTEILQVARD